MDLGLLAAAVTAVLIVAVGLYIRSFRRRLVGLRNETDRTWVTLDSYLRERNNQLPKLVETCRSYVGSGEKTLQAVLHARADFGNAETVEGKADADRILREAIDALVRVAEAVPGLQSNSNFQTVREQLEDLGENIEQSRGAYNFLAAAFNHQLAGRLGRSYARRLNCRPRQLFGPSDS